jgi:hypothetical protein
VTATRDSPNLGDSEAIDWTLKITVKRIAFKLFRASERAARAGMTRRHV